MAKIYNYFPKQTAAKTTYCEIDEHDLNEIKCELVKWLARICELDMTHDEEWRLVREQYIHRRSKLLPKGKSGENTPASFIGGMVLNTMYGDQRDLSDKQLEAIEVISNSFSQLWDDVQPIKFRIGLFR
jgi:hypothetical protein